mmetsp:Transcript_79158/g.223842  ORF Transcript_79158/g.223842 Transcript_79158/m.223842 type:complete len:480 (+) Transcript_79158:72-1511(+)
MSMTKMPPRRHHQEKPATRPPRQRIVRLGECKTPVAVARHVVQLLGVGDQARCVGHDDARLARNVVAGVPRLAGGVRPDHVRRNVLEQVLLPLALRGFRGRDAREALAAQVLECRGDPAHVLLNGCHHVRQNRGAARPSHQEQVGEAADAQAQEGAGPLPPGLAEGPAALPSHVDIQDGARHGVEACGKDDGVHLVLLPVAGDNAPGRHPHDRRGPSAVLADVNERDVGSIVCLEVAAVYAGPLAAEEALRAQQLRCPWIVHLLADLAPDKVRHVRVRLLIQPDVEEGEQKSQAPIPPQLLEVRKALLLRHGHGRGLRVARDGWHDVEGHEAGGALAHELAARGVVRLELARVIGVDGPVVGGDRIVRRALEDGEVGGHLGDFWDGLNARGARADDGHPLALQRRRPAEGAIMGPLGRMVRATLEVAETLEEPLGLLRLRETAGRTDAEACPQGPACACLKQPLPCALVKCHLGHLGVE